MDKNKMDKNKIVPIVMVATLVILAAFGVTPVIADGNPGAGCECDTKHYDTINGNVLLEQQGYAQNSPMTKIFNNVPGNIKLAKVYTGVWQGSPGKGGFFNITVNAHTTDTYKACDPCPQADGCAPWQPQRCDLLNDTINMPWNQNLDRVNMHARTVGCGVQFYSFDATPYVVSGTNTITVKTEACSDCSRGGWDGRIYVIALLVVYEDQEMPEITYWINEGALYLEKGSACDGPNDHLYASKYFYGTYVSNPSNVKLWSAGWPHVINATVPPAYTELNNNNIGVPDVTEDYAGGYNEVLLRWNNIPTGYLTTPNFLEYYDPNPLYERAFVEVLIVEGPSNEPDLTVTDIKFPTVMRPGQSCTISVTVKNQGDVAAGSFNVSLDIEKGGTNYYSDKEDVSSLGPDASTDVDFTYVMLDAGCYNFAVVADCDGDVDESDENNNEEEECYQVGNVIVVENNAELIAEADRVVGGTYYIEDRTITNCAGDGIYIENTDVPFVISNCEVYDCGIPSSCNNPGNGMLFRNVVNGEVKDSEVRGSTLKGIKMEKCSYMVIDNNNVHDNEAYGIDVYMDHMPVIDSHHITITDNHLERNLYGIELFCDECTVRENTVLYSTAWSGGEEGWGMYISGHDNKIYENTIAYSDSYGLKVDDTWIPTSGNCIFGNNLIDNNQLHAHTSQAFDNGVNFWNSTVELGYYYGGIGSSYAFDNFIGNYWDDFTCIDGNNDGICDGTYGIDDGTNTDKAPLVQEWTDYDRIPCGDVDASGGVQFLDYVKLKKNYAEGYELSCCKGCPS